MRNLSISRKVTFSLLAFGVIPILLILLGYIALVKPKLEEVSLSPFRMDAASLGVALNRALRDFAANTIQVSTSSAAADRSNWRRADGSGELVRLMNKEVADRGLGDLTMLVAPDGSVLAVNSKDKAGKDIATSHLYSENFASKPWFIEAMEGKTVFESKRSSNAVIDELTDVNSVHRFGEEPKYAFPIAAQSLDKDASLVGIWVDFVELETFKAYIAKDYENTSLVGGDIGDAWIKYDLLDSANKVLLAFRPDSASTGTFPTALVGQPADAEVQAMVAAAGKEDIFGRVLGDRAEFYVKPPAAAGFKGLDLRLAMRTPTAQAVASVGSVSTHILDAVVATAIVAVLLGWRAGRAISTPLTQIAARMRLLDQGNKSDPVPHTDRADDLGEMARAVEGFRLGAAAKEEAERSTLALRKTAEQERIQAEADRARREAELARVVKILADGLTQLSGGVLTHRLNDRFSGEYEPLRLNFNESTERLRTALSGVIESAHGITSGAGEITQAADDLARRTEHQAASLEETTAALNEITETVKKTAESAAEASRIVVGTRDDARASGKIVEEAISAMTVIEQSSRQISQILTVIDEIAFQTNLLALNAGVEAARAGDAGKGFAVVASEVRALAQRSAEAAKEIKSLISNSGHKVENGVRLVREAEENLNRIVTAVVDLSAIVESISSSTREEAIGLQQVNTAIAQMDQTTQQNAAMVEESTAASHSLANEAMALRDMIGKFQVGETQGVASRDMNGGGDKRNGPARRVA